MNQRPIIQATGVSARYDGVEALQDLSLQLHPEECLCVVGPSGCGKTTLLKILAGLIRPTDGRVLIGETEVVGPSRRVGLIFQQSTLFPWLTVRGNIAFGLKAAGVREAIRAEKVDELMRMVGLEDFGGVRPAGLSGGMAQRVSLARALATEPEVLLLDEPFGALDAVSKGQMHRVLLDVAERVRMAMVFVTHDVDEAVTIGDRILTLTRRPGRSASEVVVGLPKPRVEDGIRCVGFEEMRNSVARAARDLYTQ